MQRAEQTEPVIMVFDSGVGGLSVCQEISDRIPGARLLFVADNEAFPYGLKSEEYLVERVDYLIGQLVPEYRPSVIVIACNTASTLVLPRLRARLDIPVVGVVPAVKVAARVSRTRVIGLLATPATVSRPYTERLIADHAAGCVCLRLGTVALVEMAELLLRNCPPDPVQLRAVIEPLFRQVEGAPLDTVVLGCTHFPLLKDYLSESAPWPVNWVDSGAAIARRVESLLQAAGFASVLSRAQTPVDAHIALFTAGNASARSLEPALRARGFPEIGTV